MIAIQTAFVPATNTKPTRIKAWTCNGHKIIRSRDDSLSDVAQHFAVARQLINEQFRHGMPDHSTMAYGGTEKGYVFCWTQSTIAA